MIIPNTEIEMNRILNHLFENGVLQGSVKYMTLQRPIRNNGNACNKCVTGVTSDETASKRHTGI